MAKSLWLFNLILFFSILKSDNVFSQAPNLINYQGVARNAAGNPLQNQTIYLRVNIRTGSSQGTIQFSETRSVKTNAWGLFAVQIGSPGFMSSIGTLAGVTWMQGDKFMEVEIDPTASNNYINLGSTQLLSVPYALNAVSAGTASPIGGAGGDLSGSYPNPTIANNKITSLKLADSSVVTSKVANFSITDIKIESVSGSKIIGDINGNAKNVNGIVAIANGGTGASNTSDAKKNFLIDSVDNTTDLRKPISIATQNALNQKLNISDTFGTFSNRLKISDTAVMLTNRLKISDTANLMLNYRRTTTKIENADLSKSTISGVSLGDNLKSLSTSYGLTGTGFNGSTDITDWKVDTAAISTKANVTALLEGYTKTGSIATKLNISDTASMLSNRLRISDTASMLANRLKSSDTTVMLANRLKISDTANLVSNYRRASTKIENADLSKSTISGVSLGDNLKSLSTSYGLSGTGFNGSADITDWKVDTSAISTKANVTALLEGYTTTGSIAAKLNISDTASMLSNRLRISDTAVMLANRLKISDTANLMSNYRRTTTKIENADLSKSTISGVSLGDNLKSLSTSYGLTGTGFNGSTDITDWKVDTAAISTKANVTALLEGYTTTGSIATKLNISDTASMLSNRLRISDTASMLTNRLKISDTAVMLANRLKISDTANFVSNYRRTTTKIENADLSKSTISGVSLGDNLKSLSTSYGLSGTGFNGSVDVTNWKVDTAAISTKANVTALLEGYTTTGSIATKLNISDTASMLSNRLRISDTASMLANRLKISDTANLMSNYRRTTTKIENADLSKSTISGVSLGDNLKSLSTSYGLSGTGFNGSADITDWKVDTSAISTKANVTGLLAGYATTGSVGNLDKLTDVKSGGENFSNSIIVGHKQTGTLSNASQNTVLGLEAFKSVTSATNNSVLGFNAMRSNLSGSNNVALGSHALLSNTTGSDNISVGYNAMLNNVSAIGNVAIGSNSLNSGTTGNYNVAVGHQSMVNNTTGDVNTALGYTSLYGNTTGRYNVALGVQALESNTTGNNNTAIGVGTLDRNTGGNENAILGAFAGRYIADGSTYNTSTSNSVLIGANIRVNGVGQSNQIVIGHNAIGNGSNTIQLGNTNITNVKTSGTITAGAVTYPNVDGNNGDLLATNGSGVVSFIAPTLVREVADEFSATANQTSFTLTQTKAANSKVKMFINGVRISNTAYSVVGTTLTYIPANNGNTNLSLNDRIQFDYYY